MVTNKKAAYEKLLQGGIWTEHTLSQVTTIRTKVTLWKWILPGNEQGSTSREKNSDEEC